MPDVFLLRPLKATIFLCVLFFSASGIAFLINFDVGHVASGVVINSPRSIPIVANKTGTVARIHVANGDYVEKNSVILTYDDPVLNTRYGEVEKEIGTTKILIARLRAQTQFLDVETLARQLNDVQSSDSSQVELQLQAYFSILNEFNANIAEVESELRAQEVALEGYVIQVAGMKEAVEATKAYVDRQKKLKDLGLVTETDFSNAALRQISEDNRLLNARQVVVEAHARIKVFQTRKKVIEDEFISGTYGELQNALGRITRLEKEKAILEAEITSLSIKSPTGGEIFAESFPIASEVIIAGQVLFELIPKTEGLVIRVEVPPRILPSLSVGQATGIFIGRLGTQKQIRLDGIVAEIAPTASKSGQTSEMNYAVFVDVLPATAVGMDSTIPPFTAVQVVFETHTESFYSRLLKPLREKMDLAFRSE